MITKKSSKYKYIDYLVYAITFFKQCIWTYVISTGHKVAKVENSDILVILVRIFIVYVIRILLFIKRYRHVVLMLENLCVQS